MLIDLTDDTSENTNTLPVIMGNVFPFEMKIVRKKNKDLEDIFIALNEIVISMRIPTSCDWNYEDRNECFHPTIVFESQIRQGRIYRFKIHFPVDFPKSPPSFEPVDLLPALSFVTISYHPIFCAKYWKDFQNLSELFRRIIQHLDQIPGGLIYHELSTFPAPKGKKGKVETFIEQASSFLPEFLIGPKGRVPLLNLHHLITEFYGIYKDEIKGYANLDDTVLSLLPEDFCVFLGSTTGNDNTVGKGIGYTGGFGGYGGSAPSSRKPEKTRSQEIIEAIGSILVSKISDVLSAQWVLESPLIDILSMLLKQYSTEEISRHTALVQSIYKLFYALDGSLDVLIQAADEVKSEGAPEDLTTQDDPNIIRKISKHRVNQIQEFIRSGYKRLQDPVVVDLFPAKSPWIKDIKSSSLFPPVLVDIDEKAEDNESPSKKVGQKVYHLADLEKGHYFAKQATNPSAFVKCPKSWLKELSFIHENLTEELTLFVSEDHPNYLTACMHILNPDSPYYGGSYLFDIMIPANYPQTSPKVQYMTTGGGTVRFNPNLYNCGKVCLSLLGTWAGEPWNPAVSNLTQVLKSILYLIFTEEPFYNEPGYQFTSRLAPQSLGYNKAIVSNQLNFAILAHLQATPTNPHTSTTVPEIQEYLKNYYREHWYEILPNLTTQLQDLYKPYSQFQSTLKKISDLLPPPPPVITEEESLIHGKVESSSIDANMIDLTDTRANKRSKKN